MSAEKLFDAEAFGRRLRVRIAERHISVREAAAEIGCSHGTVSRVCNCNPPDVENYLRMEQWLQDGQPASSEGTTTNPKERI